MKVKSISIIKYFLLFAVIYFPIFGHLDTLPIRNFDEARLALNAYEMLNNGNLIVTHFEEKPDMWNTKPPLMIWLQVLFMKLIGVNELSIRLPAAIAAFLICIFLLIFSARHLNDPWFGIIACIVLSSTVGYIHVHATRTGDYDSLLTLFTTLYPLLFFIYIETKRTRYLYFTFIALTLSVLTKGVAGLLFVPVLPLFAVFKRNLVSIIKSKHLYIGFGIFLFFAIGYYLLRESMNPGFIKVVWNNEVGGRYVEVIEGHKGGFWYYYRLLVDHLLVYWYILIPCGVLVGLFHKNPAYRNLTIYLVSLVLFYFLVISFGKTKLQWYAVPLYPFLAMIVAIFINFVFQFLVNISLFRSNLRINVLPYIFLFLVSIKPVSHIIGRMNPPKEFSWEVDKYRMGYLLKDALKGKLDLSGYTLLHGGYAPHHYFYITVMNDKGIDISLRKDAKNLKPNEKVFAQQSDIKNFISENYTYEVIKTNKDVVFYQITGTKNHD
jgi:4-amino-4-deoxy-L-arabinose transferase-like glycosyltransferase